MIDALTGDKKLETTQWGDAQRKLGNFDPLPKPASSNRLYKQSLYTAKKEERRKNHARDLDEIDAELEDRCTTTAGPRAAPGAEDEEQELLRLRAARMNTLNTQKLRNRFGEVLEIRKTEFVKQVNEASIEPVPGIIGMVREEEEDPVVPLRRDEAALAGLSEDEDEKTEKRICSSSDKPSTNGLMKPKQTEAEAIAQQAPSDRMLTSVVVFLYQQTMPACQMINQVLDELARVVQCAV